MALTSTLLARALRSPLVTLLLLLPFVVPGCDDDETSTRSMATCPNELPVDGTPCAASQLGFQCTYIVIDDTIHCELHHEAECRGASGASAWSVETAGCSSGGGGAGGQGGSAGAGGSSTSSTSTGSAGGGFGGAGGGLGGAGGGAAGGGGIGGAGGS